ncbi:PadR family transcriptional regulator [Acidobacteriota bacterium]
MYKLTKHEELILTSIWKLTGNAYIVTIRKHFAGITGKTINSGSLCNTLTSLVRKGLLESEESQPTALQGGRRKVLYSLTREGKKALNQAFAIQKRVWDGFSEFNA